MESNKNQDNMLKNNQEGTNKPNEILNTNDINNEEEQFIKN